MKWKKINPLLNGIYLAHERTLNNRKQTWPISTKIANNMTFNNWTRTEKTFFQDRIKLLSETTKLLPTLQKNQIRNTMQQLQNTRFNSNDFQIMSVFPYFTEICIKKMLFNVFSPRFATSATKFVWTNLYIGIITMCNSNYWFKATDTFKTETVFNTKRTETKRQIQRVYATIIWITPKQTHTHTHNQTNTQHISYTLTHKHKFHWNHKELST